MKKLYRFFWDCGRQGEVNGIFVAEEENIKESLGKEVYFGEILGKHSEICGELSEEDFEVLTDDQEFIKKFQEFGCASGYNPLSYLQ